MPEWLSTDWFSLTTLRSFVWESPLYLYAILGIPVLFLLRWLLSSSSGRKLNLNLTEKTYNSSWQSYLRYIIPVFLSLGLAFLCISLARPQRTLQLEEKLTEGINIVLALDISESMLTTDLAPNRLEAAKEVARQFLQNRTSDKIGLVIFAGEAFTLCPLTSDYSLLEDYLESVSSDLITTSGTAIGSAIATSINRLRDTPGESKTIILLSDGDNTAGSLAPETATDLANSFGIRIYTIAIGRNQLSARKTLNEVAESSQGAFYSATSKETLNTVFQEINALEKTRFENSAVKDLRDYYYIYLNWAVVFFLLAFFLKNTFLGNLLMD